MSKEESFWTVADGWDTMYMLWNWTDKAEDVVVTFYYSDGSGNFKLPVHLEAQGSTNHRHGQVIAAGQPDADGNVIPARVRRGSAVFASRKGVRSPMRLGLCGMHFSAQLGVAEACCIDCSGYCGLFITPSPIYCLVGLSVQLKAQSYYSDGTLHDFTGSSNWSSNNTAIATVETTGQTTPGLCTAVAGGSCTITASRSLTAQGVHLVGCGGCPGLQVMTDQATANGQKPNSLKVLAVTVIADDSTGGCTTKTGYYGIRVTVQYQVMDQNTPANPIKSSSMEADEQLLNYVLNGKNYGDPEPNWVKIASTDSNGTFLDTPYGTCATGAFTNTFTQPVSIVLAGARYSVRDNDTKITSSSAHQGTISNGSDIYKTR